MYPWPVRGGSKVVLLPEVEKAEGLNSCRKKPRVHFQTRQIGKVYIT